MPCHFDLDEATMYLRELLSMNRQELLSEVQNHPDLCRDKARRADMIIFAFERKFDANAKPPIRLSKATTPYGEYIPRKL